MPSMPEPISLKPWGPSKNACIFDARNIAAFWRRKISWRLNNASHSGVLWVMQPFVPLAAFKATFSEDWDELAVKTATVTTHVKLLETTREVEEFCAFNLVNEKRGAGPCKLLSTGELLIVVPPIEVTHTYSKAAGARVHFLYGWVKMTIVGNISKTEGMLEPAQGWRFVEWWIRDKAFDMLSDLEMAVSEEMVAASEAKLRSEFPSDQAFDMARVHRSMVAEHYVMPRPRTKEQVVRMRKKAAEMQAEGLEDGFHDVPMAEDEADAGITRPPVVLPLPLPPLPPLALPLSRPAAAAGAPPSPPTARRTPPPEPLMSSPPAIAGAALPPSVAAPAPGTTPSAPGTVAGPSWTPDVFEGLMMEALAAARSPLGSLSDSPSSSSPLGLHKLL